MNEDDQVPIAMTHQCDKLPGPDDRPSSDVVIYDEECRFCRLTAESLDRFDVRDYLAFLPLQDDRVAKRYPDLSRVDLERHVYVIDRNGNRHRGAGAVRYLSRRLPLLWPLAPVLHVPGSMPIWQWFYHQISVRRHFLDRRKTTDSTPSQKET